MSVQRPAKTPEADAHRRAPTRTLEAPMAKPPQNAARGESAAPTLQGHMAFMAAVPPRPLWEALEGLPQGTKATLGRKQA